MTLKYTINKYRRYSYWNKHQAIFIHVPKAAGTSINHAIYGRTLGHYTANELKATFPRLFERSFVFSFVRNPWDRAASAYRFAKQGRTESMGIANSEHYRVPEFETFEKFVLEWLPAQDLVNSDFVFQLQSRFIFDKNGVNLCDFIGKVETMQSDIEIVKQRLGRDFTVKEMNTTKTSTSYRGLYSLEMADVIAKLYASDISAFEYEF